MKFNSISSKDGVIQMIENITGLGLTSISSDATQMAYFTVLVNQWRRVMAFYAWKVDKNWSFDDANQTTFNTGLTTIYDGQRDYTLPTSALRLRQVEVKASDGKYYTLNYISERDARLKYAKGQEEKGLPINYRLSGRSIILYPAPDVTTITSTEGLRVSLDREMVEILVDDTTKEMGFDKMFDSIMYYGPAFEWSTLKGIASVQALCTRMLGNFPGLTEMFNEFYGTRNQDQVIAISPVKNRYK